MTKKRVGILFGGCSAEHEVSLQSAKNVFDAIDRDKYEPVLIGIDKNGKWLLENSGGGGNEFLLDADNPKKIRLNPNGKPVVLLPASGGIFAHIDETGQKTQVDVIFPILHGPLGEDGTIQGLLKLAGVPFAGVSVLGSAAGMDKDVMKRLLREAGIPIAKYMTVHSRDITPDFNTIVETVGLPHFIKPANMGSSIGVNKAHNEAEYIKFVRDAFQYDTKIVIEEYIKGRELECSVLGNDKPITSLPGEIKPRHEFYSYNAKYIDENGAGLVIPAELPDQKIKEIQTLAIKTYKTLCAEGLSRIDFFMRDDGALLVNEINTMPGFTKISMYPKLFENRGISYSNLIDRLIELAFERYEQESKLKTNYI
ncbi:MAG: D-alanine--D-alanine ligase [Spirochaetaceae bacterium]|jgi:D-alanine-D-alanine ligase|nr:D-alanine--D-alanine ligase [Spirochaetaceae bacterium]